MENLATTTLPFLALVGCGYLAGRRGFIGEEAVTGLNRFVFFFALPALVFRALATRPVAEILDPRFIVLYAGVGVCAFAVAALLARRLLGAGLGAAVVQGQGAAVSNIGYMGVPLLIALLGEAATVPVVLAMLCDMLFIQTPAMMALEIDRARHGGAPATPGRVARAFATNPFVMAIIAGGAVAALGGGGGPPGPVDAFTRLLGGAAGPCALFALGATLAGRPVSRGRGAVALMCAAKLVLHPGLMALALALPFAGALPPTWRATALLAAALPVAGNVFVVARNFGVHAEETSTAILVSTVIAVFSFSALALVLAP